MRLHTAPAPTCVVLRGAMGRRSPTRTPCLTLPDVSRGSAGPSTSAASPSATALSSRALRSSHVNFENGFAPSAAAPPPCCGCCRRRDAADRLGLVRVRGRRSLRRWLCVRRSAPPPPTGPALRHLPLHTLNINRGPSSFHHCSCLVLRTDLGWIRGTAAGQRRISTWKVPH